MKLLTCLTSHFRLLRSIVEPDVFVFLSALSSFALWLFPLQVWISEPWKYVMVWQSVFRLFVVGPQQRINQPVVSGSTQHRIRATSIFLCVWHHAQPFPEQGGQMVLAKMTMTLKDLSLSSFFNLCVAKRKSGSWRRLMEKQDAYYCRLIPVQ